MIAHRTVIALLIAGLAAVPAVWVMAHPMRSHTQPTVHSAASAAQLAKPNIVFILTDDQDVATMAYMPRVKAWMVDQGLTFSNMFVTYSVCCPSRASILTGQYPHNHDNLFNNAPLGGFEKFRDQGREASTVGTWLQAAGYRTAFIGKYLNGYADPRDRGYVPPGWDEWYVVNAGPTRYFNYRMTENGRVAYYGDAPADYQTDVLARQTADFLDRAMAPGAPPFFLYYAPPAPHADTPGDGPATAAPRHQQLFADVSAPRTPSFNEEDVSDKPSFVQRGPLFDDAMVGELDHAYRTRLRSLQAVDEAVEQLFQKLAEHGHLANTYVFLTSDNGYRLGQHRLPQGKNTAYEEDIRVPLVVRGPGLPAGVTHEHFVLNIDLAPTFAELAGTTGADFVDGRSLVALLGRDAPPSSAWRQDFLIERHLPPPAGPAANYFALRTQDTTYVEYANGERELYDLREDPYQLNSLHALARPERLAALSARLAQLANCVADTCR
jgi:N-acetylglucosamine-6-sulfatase